MAVPHHSLAKIIKMSNFEDFSIIAFFSPEEAGFFGIWVWGGGLTGCTSNMQK